MPGGIQCLPDRTHTAVHHIGGRYHVRSCLHVGEGGHGQKLQCFVIIDIASAEHTAVSVGSVFAHTYIRDQVHVRKITSGLSQRALDDAFGAVCLGADLVFLLRDTKKHHFVHAGLCQAGKFFFHPVYCIAVLTRKCLNLLDCIFAIHDKHRVDQ